MAPAESKVVGGKALRQKTRGAQSQQDAQTTQAKIVAHQKELHAKRQADGLARYEAGGGAGAGQEGKGWKRFVSYKGEAGLPEEVKDARVRVFIWANHSSMFIPLIRYMSTSVVSALFYPSKVSLCRSTSIPLRTPTRTKKGSTPICVSISRPLAS